MSHSSSKPGPKTKQKSKPKTKPKLSTFLFSDALLAWFDEHGRKHLPWQHPIEPYRVWLSEVMLQQTQVDTVIPYFTRFMDSFPSVFALAEADLDEVLHLWTGLGYYARARNLHKCAQQIVEQYNGVFPCEPDQLIDLPGIGKSTAHAITSIAFGKPTAILDGNVKRVLARLHTEKGWTGAPKVQKKLWEYAEQHMPSTRCADYTQAIMDLGATLCKRSRPACELCPVSYECKAYIENTVAQYPERKPSKKSPIKSTVMLIIQDSTGKILLTQRPPQGIWGGLWSFYEFEDVDQAITKSTSIGLVTAQNSWSEVNHVFSHFKLNITPLMVNVEVSVNHSVQENTAQQWVTLEDALKLGLAAPVKRLIEQVQQNNKKLLEPS